MTTASKLKISLYLAGIFLAGAVAGGAVTFAIMQERSLPHVTAADFSQKHLKRMIRELNLTPDQVRAIRPIVVEISEDVKLSRRKSILELVSLLREMNARIEPILTPRQKAKLHEMVKRRNERVDRYIGNNGRRNGEHRKPAHERKRDLKPKPAKPAVPNPPPAPEPAPDGTSDSGPTEAT